MFFTHSSRNRHFDQYKQLKKIVKKWIKENNSFIKPFLGYYDYNAFEPKDFYGSRDKLNSILKFKCK